MRVLAHLISHNKGRMAEQFEYGIRLSLRQLINAIEVIGGYGCVWPVVAPFPQGRNREFTRSSFPLNLDFLYFILTNSMINVNTIFDPEKIINFY